MGSCHEGIGEAELGNHGGDMVMTGPGVRSIPVGLLLSLCRKHSEYFFLLQFLLLLMVIGV